MTKRFTPEDLIQFLYQECSPTEAIEIKAALKVDEVLAKTYLELKEGYNILDGAETYTPSQSSINIILKHSKGTALETSY